MKQLFLITLVLSVSTSLAQELVIKNMNIFQNEIKLSNSEIKEKLATDVNALENYKASKTKSTVGGLVLGFGLGFVLADAVIGGNAYNYKFPGTPTFIGLGAIAVSIPILSGREKLLKKSIETYNLNSKTKLDNTENNLELNILSNNNCVGFQLNF